MKIRKVGVYCGARWYSIRDWKLYSFRRFDWGFSIGPILFWDGS